MGGGGVGWNYALNKPCAGDAISFDLRPPDKVALEQNSLRFGLLPTTRSCPGDHGGSIEGPTSEVLFRV